MISRAWVFAAIVIVAAACAHAVPPAPPREPSLGLAISTTTLGNGLRVVIVRDATAGDVQVTTRVAAGAIDDGVHPGLAHLVEHLMYQQELDGQPLFAHLEGTATYFNAATTQDATTFISRARKAALPALLAIEIARFELRCTPSDAVFANERDVVLSEIQQRAQVSQVFAQLHRAVYPPGHPYQIDLGGTPATLAAITRADACAFIDQHYAPSNAALVISGDLSGDDVRAALAQLERGLTARTAAPPRAVPQVTPMPHHAEVDAPLDEDVFVLAWPLPADPRERARVRAVAAAIPRLVDAEIKGTVVGLELGDQRAPMTAIAVLPGDDETFGEAAAGVRRALEQLPAMFADTGSRVDRVAFDRLKQGAIHRRYAALEDGSDRDTQLATYVLAGLDPQQAIAMELGVLAKMTRADGAQIAAQYLAVGAPTGVTLKAQPGRRSGLRASLQTPPHDMGPRRSPVDPARAAQPLDAALATTPPRARTRVLPNGLRIVMLPLASVPTFDARLVFGSGTADEPEYQRGVALLAAHTLTWDLHYFDDLVAFAGAGGIRDTDVGPDRTTFSVQGLDTQLDVVLAGLRRWVREGVYDDSASSYVRALRRATKRVDDQGAVTDAWRAALFGPRHPYVRAGISRHASASLTLGDASAFRASHYTPDNATLVIAGRFDPALADRWIDYLFADWQGTRGPRVAPPLAPQPLSLARADDVALVQLRIAVPAPAGAARAAELVAAEMLASIARDVRYRLGASYTVDAQLAEMRPGSFFVLDGYVDATRATAAVRSIRERLAALRTDATAAAQLFGVAGDRVGARLQADPACAPAHAAGVEQELAAGRAPLSDLDAARAVAALRITDLTGVLAQLDLSRATILMSGPRAELDAAFAELGRTPAYLTAPAPQPTTPANTAAVPSLEAYEQHVQLTDLRPALTVPQPPDVVWSIMPGGGLDASRLGGSLGLAVGVRRGARGALGLHLSTAYIEAADGTRSTPLYLEGFYRFGSTAVFVDALVGLHVDDPELVSGIQLGIYLARFGWHRLSLAGRYEHAGTDGLVSFGLHLGT